MVEGVLGWTERASRWLTRRVGDNRRLLVLLAIVVMGLVGGVGRLMCGRTCQAGRAAAEYVEALAGGDFESYAAVTSQPTHEGFDLQLSCLDWDRVEVGDVYDSPVSVDLKSVALITPSGSLVLHTIIRPPKGDDMEGKGFMVIGTSSECLPDLEAFLRLVDDLD